ncbi:MAG: helix-turn-helix transcriptional regulator [Gemmobacter sp.]|uniref:helix-turn-helix domain-containing protein n=1 Tax=Gemmobacter sp. TaxID=1898957 RepID=UPI001A384126|nr:helix-turn-helix transcriptional regulator [Gemmobacter sp.]MBL8560854.1 helix-turn-helix transcriptional regulator [Gemmobacter sp.]
MVLGVFAANLRRLCSSRGVTLAQAARDLDLGKVQFQRFLRAESFPKPNLLHRICLYFGTDARILTEAWPFAAPPPPPAEAPPLAGLVQAARYAGLSPAYFDPDPGLPDGHYTFFRRSMSLGGHIARSVVQIKTLEQCRILRAYDVPVAPAPGWPPRRLRDREFRGMVLRQAVGTTILLVHEASQALSSIYLQPQTSHFADTRYYGVTNYGRMSQPEVTNTTRVVWIAVPPRLSLILRAHRARGLYKPDAVPQDIADFLLHPL